MDSANNYYCHACSVPVAALAEGDNISCPQCGGSFLEEIPRPQSAPVASANSDRNNAAANVNVDDDDDEGWEDCDDDEEEDGEEDEEDGDGGHEEGDDEQGNPDGQIYLGLNNILGELLHNVPEFQQLANLFGVGNNLFHVAGVGGGGAGGGFGGVLFPPVFNHPAFRAPHQQPGAGAQVFGDFAVGNLAELINGLNLMGNNPNANPPANAAYRSSLPVYVVTAGDVAAKVECAICMEALQYLERVSVLTCNHKFHPSCIKPWLEQHSSCPSCRFQLPKEGETWTRPPPEEIN